MQKPEIWNRETASSEVLFRKGMRRRVWCGKSGMLFAVFLICQIAGCTMSKDFETNKMMSYMGCKYGETFDFVESYAGQVGKNYRMILVKSREHTEREALVRLSEINGKRHYEDNYLAFLLRDELEQTVGDFARRCFGECKIYYKIPAFVFPFYFKADMTPEEFLKNPCSMPQFYIYLQCGKPDREEWEEKLDRFREMNGVKGYKIRGTLSFAASEQDYEMINRENFAGSDYDTYSAVDELLFSMDEKGNFRYMRWLSDKSA